MDEDRESVVGIATRCGMDASNGGVARDFFFSTPVKTVPAAQRVSYSTGIGGAFPGIKRPESGVDHLPAPSSR